MMTGKTWLSKCNWCVATITICVCYKDLLGEYQKKDHKAFSKTAKIRESSLKASLFPKVIVHTEDQS